MHQQQNQICNISCQNWYWQLPWRWYSGTRWPNDVRMADSKGNGTVTFKMSRLPNMFSICNVKIDTLTISFNILLFLLDIEMFVFMWKWIWFTWIMNLCCNDQNLSFLFYLGVSVAERIRPSWPGGEKCSRLWRQASEGSWLWIVA